MGCLVNNNWDHEVERARDGQSDLVSDNTSLATFGTASEPFRQSTQQWIQRVGYILVNENPNPNLSAVHHDINAPSDRSQVSDIPNNEDLVSQKTVQKVAEPQTPTFNPPQIQTGHGATVETTEKQPSQIQSSTSAPYRTSSAADQP